MSESYPKSKVWPFVFSGMLLFVLVLRPTSWPAPNVGNLSRSVVGRIFSVWMAHVGRTDRESRTPSKPKVVGYEPWKHRKLAEPDVGYSEIAPAPTSNVKKEAVVAGDPHLRELGVEVISEDDWFVRVGA